MVEKVKTLNKESSVGFRGFSLGEEEQGREIHVDPLGEERDLAMACEEDQGFQALLLRLRHCLWRCPRRHWLLRHAGN